MYRPTNNIGPIEMICMIFRVFVEASQFEMAILDLVAMKFFLCAM